MAKGLVGSQLQEFRLGGNEIGNDGAVALANALEDTKLTKLIVDTNAREKMTRAWRMAGRNPCNLRFVGD